MQHGRAVCYAVIVTAMWKEFWGIINHWKNSWNATSVN
jgi:hypothetical protein